MRTRVLAVLTVAAGAAVLAGPGPLPVAGGMLLGFVLPGMALTGALFPGRTLSPVERTLLAPALSLGALVVAGLGIHLTGADLDRLSWTVATVGVTLVGLLVAVLRPRLSAAAPAGQEEAAPAGEALPVLPLSERDAEAVAEAHTIAMSVAPVEAAREPAATEQSPRLRLARQLLPLALVLAILGGASWLSFGTSRELYDTEVTALSAAPPGPVDSRGNRTVTVSATGLLAEDAPYTLTVTGTPGTAPSRRTITVGADGTWSENLSVPGDERTTVSLFRAGDTSAYRTLYISAAE
ncbi:DUF1616 domain-containing protein [Couchioplanes azureus]|uniref:DUF1616 domain-containing protein n=1 Tax=Couchioplanes caeruleus TaxID=56438 RepID=UPI001670F736|nr:DUF1616 domain-containing protein [Couchioplanes caeruleus]